MSSMICTSQWRIVPCKHTRAYSLLVISLLVTVCGISQAYYSYQPLNTDSLSKILGGAKGENRVKTLILLSAQYQQTKPDTSLYYAQQAYDLALNLDDPDLKYRCNYNLGLAFHHTANYAEAIWHGLDAQQEAFEKKDNEMLMKTTSYVVLAYLYSGNENLAIRNAFHFYQTAGEIEDPFARFDLEIRMGWVYKYAKRFNNALYHFTICDSIARHSGKIPPLHNGLNIKHMGDCHMSLKNYNKALDYYLELSQIKAANKIPSFPTLPWDIGKCFHMLGKPDSAMKYYRRALVDYQKDGEVMLVGYIHLSLGSLFDTLQQWKTSIQHYEQAIHAGNWIIENKLEEVNPDPRESLSYVPEQRVPEYMEQIGLEIILKAHWNSYLAFQKLKDPARALIHLEHYITRKKEMDAILNQKEVTELATRYETERKEEDIIRLSREKELAHSRLIKTRNTLFVLLALMLLLIISAILLARQYRMKNIHETSLLKQKLFRAQMNPHFIFNALSSIQGIIMEKDHIRAATYLSRFAKLVRNILEGSLEEMVPLEKEIETIEHYLQLQEIRYSGHIGHSIYVDEELKERQIYMPPMLVQPFVENAIEHGLKHRNTTGMVSVSFRKVNKTLEIEVYDNGIGRKQSEELEKGNKNENNSLSTSLILDRLKTLNRENRLFHRNNKFSLKITDLTDSSGNVAGTRVILKVPL